MTVVTKLHVGCFDVPLDGWYNADVTMHIAVARIPFLAAFLHGIGILDDVRYSQHKKGVFRVVHYVNAAKQLPFKNDSLTAVYSSHMIVNFTRQQTLQFLREVHRVLQPRGIVRLAAPDMNEFIRGYNPLNPDKTLELLYQPSVKGEKNRIHWMYNAVSLKEIMTEASFIQVTQCEMFKGKCPDVERIDYRTDSIFMEGIK